MKRLAAGEWVADPVEDAETMARLNAIRPAFIELFKARPILILFKASADGGDTMGEGVRIEMTPADMAPGAPTLANVIRRHGLDPKDYPHVLFGTVMPEEENPASDEEVVSESVDEITDSSAD